MSQLAAAGVLQVTRGGMVGSRQPRSLDRMCRFVCRRHGRSNVEFHEQVRGWIVIVPRDLNEPVPLKESNGRSRVADGVEADPLEAHFSRMMERVVEEASAESSAAVLLADVQAFDLRDVVRQAANGHRADEPILQLREKKPEAAAVRLIFLGNPSQVRMGARGVERESGVPPHLRKEAIGGMLITSLKRTDRGIGSTPSICERRR
jgi:hypothetical protein